MKNKLTFFTLLIAVSAQLAHADQLPDPLSSPDTAKVAKPAPAATAAPVLTPKKPVESAPIVPPAPATQPAPAPAPAPAATVHVEQQIATRANVPTFRQLDELRSQNAVLAEMVKAAELRAKLSGQGVAPGGANAGAASAAPQVVSVYGLDGKLTAVLNMGNGATFKAREGSNIPGVGHVKSITRDEVVVKTKQGALTLGFLPVNGSPGVH